MSDWYYESKGERIGPVTADNIKRLYAEKTLSTESLVWNKDFGSDWKALKDAGIDGLHTNTGGIIGPPPLPHNPSRLNPTQTEDDLTEEFLSSDITRTIIGDRIDYYQARWRRILEKSTGGPGKLHQINSWNWAAFLLSIFWLAYRRMYKTSAILAAVLIFVGLFGQTGTLLNFLIIVAVGLYGNSLYMQNVFNRYKDIKNTRDKSLSQSMTLRAGGVSWVGGFVALFLIMTAQGLIEIVKNDGQVFSSGVSCSAQTTQNTVQSIARKNLKNQMIQLYGVDPDKSTTMLQYIRTQGKDGNLTNCAAHITYNLFIGDQQQESMKQAVQIMGQAFEKDITYTVQPSDDNKNIYVVVNGL